MIHLFYLIYILKDCLISLGSEINSKNVAGFYTDGVGNVEVVVPVKVTKEGAFVSHYLPHYYDVMSRPKRDSSTAIHFTIPINGKKQHLELWPHHSFLAPGLVIERRDVNAVENISAAKFKKLPRNQCHYNGQIVGQPKSRAALSTCNGLVGFIKLPNEEYLIEPMKDSKPTHGKEHPHIIYKRSDQKQKSKTNCGTHGSAKTAFKDRMVWEALNSKQSPDDVDEVVPTNTNSKVENNFFEVKDFDRGKTVSFYNDQTQVNQSTDRESIPSERHQLYNKASDSIQSCKLNGKDENLYIENKDQLDDINNNYYNKVINKNKHYLIQNKKHIENSLNNDLLNNIEQKDISLIDIKGVPKEEGENSELKEKLNFKDQQDENLFNKLTQGNNVNGDNSMVNSAELTNQNAIKSEDLNILKEINKDTSEIKYPYKIKEMNREKRQASDQLYFDTSDLKTKNRETKKTRKILRRENSDFDPIYKSDQIKNVLLDSTSNGENLKRSESKSIEKSQKINNTDETNLDVDYDSILSIKEKRSNISGSYFDDSSFISEDFPHEHNKGNKLQAKVDVEHNDLLGKTNIKPTLEDNKACNLRTNKKENDDVDCPQQSVNKIDSEVGEENVINLNSKLSNENHKSGFITKNSEPQSSNIYLKRETNGNANQNINSTSGIEKSLNISKSVTDGGSNHSIEVGTESIEKTKNDKESDSKLNIESNFNNSKKAVLGEATLEKSVIDKESEIKVNSSLFDNSREVVTMKTIDEKSARYKDGKQLINTYDKDVNPKKAILAENTTVEESTSKIHVNNSIPNINVGNVKLIDLNSAIESVISENSNRDEKNADVLGDRNINEIHHNNIKNDYEQNVDDVNFKLNEKSTREIKENGKKNNSERVNDDSLQAEKSDNEKSMIKRKIGRDTQTFSDSKIKLPNKDNDAKDVIGSFESNKYFKDNNFKYLRNDDKEKVTDEKNYLSSDDKNEDETDSSNNSWKANVCIPDNNVGMNKKYETMRLQNDDESEPQCNEYFMREYNLELMITVDHKVMELHASDDIEIFILTIINMVASNFYDVSLGLNMNVALVRLILLTNCVKQLDVETFSPSELLENFCAWQDQINPGKDNHPNHHDLAILITRLQQCEGEVLGIGYMTSLCRSDKSCVVCVDEGLLLANIITHQIGHSLGAEHDEGQDSGCPDSEVDGTTYHMGPNIRQTNSEWTVCSRESILQFIRSQGSSCLTDSPTEHNFNFPSMLPGQIYSVAQQCKLNFQMYAMPCAIGKFCEKLYCQISADECVTKGEPPADGTFCAADMWCFKKDCVTMGRRPGAVNGEWGKWTDWTQCTRSCGGGVQMSYRLCNNPKPAKGGRYCVGKRIRYRMCSTVACQGFTQSFRDLQCKRSEEHPYRGRYHSWVRYNSFFRNIECSLVCQNTKGQVVMRSPVAVDGTPCKAGTRNVCIQGTCVNVGCDWVIDSNAKEDSCGVCHGNGTGCRIIQGRFDEATQSGKAIMPFLQIPTGSGMIYVREINPSYNLIAVSGAINKIFYLNGKGRHDDATPGDMVFGLTHGTYEIRSNMERIFIRGPTTEPLVFHAVFNGPNTGIRYQYAIPETDPTYVPRYQWQYIDWEPCSEPCSGGAQRSHAKCVEDKGGVVDDTYCMNFNRPMDVIRPCNNFPCQAKWWVSIWSECICTGSERLMFRSVVCMRSKNEDSTRAEIVVESECKGIDKPISHKPCNQTNVIADCYKRSVLHPGSNKSSLNIRPYRAVAPMLYPVKHSPGFKNSSEEKHSSKTNSFDETTVKLKQSKSPGRDRVFNRLEEASPLMFNLVDEIPSRTLTKVKGAADKLQKHMFSSRKQGLPSNKVFNRYQNGRFDASGLTRLNESGRIIQKNKSQSNISRVRNNFQKNAPESEYDEVVETGRSGYENGQTSDTSCGTTKPLNEPCETTTTVTTTTTTCISTQKNIPHQKTTCCRKQTFLSLSSQSKPVQTTTEDPLVTKVDELNLNDFGLTVIPVFPPNRKLPQTDDEFSNFGEVGLYKVGSLLNSSIVMGQDALDLIQKARENATEPPVIHHEEEE